MNTVIVWMARKPNRGNIVVLSNLFSLVFTPSLLTVADIHLLYLNHSYIRNHATMVTSYVRRMLSLQQPRSQEKNFKKLSETKALATTGSHVTIFFILDQSLVHPPLIANSWIRIRCNNYEFI